jgi:hypothetical protein
VLTSDANGLSSWQTPAAGGDSSIHKYDLTLTGNRTLNGNGNDFNITDANYFSAGNSDNYIDSYKSTNISFPSYSSINTKTGLFKGLITTESSSAPYTGGLPSNLADQYLMATNTKAYLQSEDGVNQSRIGINAKYAVIKSDSIFISHADNNTSNLLMTGTKIALKSDTITIDIPSKGLNKVLTSDAAGNATWQAPIGGGLATADFIYNEEFTGSATLAITIANTAVANKYNVYKNGVLLPLSQYTLSGTTLTLVSRDSADDISITYIK